MTQNVQPPSITLEEPPEDLSGIAEHFHPLAREVGVDLFRLVYASNVFQHGINELLVAGGGGSQLRVHLQILGSMFNMLTLMLMREREWTEEQIAQVNRRTEEVLRTKIIIARGDDRRLFDS